MRFSALLAATLAFPLTASAVPTVLNHQGRLADAAGLPLEGAHTVVFALYDAPTGGSVVWTEEANLNLEDGYFHAILGGTSPLDGELLDGRVLYLGITIDGSPELPGRTPLSSVPYAIRASVATTATSVSGGGPVDAASVTVNGVTVIAEDGTIGWDRITGYEAPESALDALGCGPGEIPLFDGVGWGCASPNDHEHDASALTSGTVDVARLPIGSGASDVAAGDHTHALTELTGELPLSRTNGDLDIARVTGDLPISRVTGDLPMSRVTGDLPISRVTGDLPMTRVTGDLPIARVTGDLPMTRVTGDLPMTRVTGDLPMTRVTGNLDASRLTGSVPFSALPVGTTGSTVAVGNHTHDAASIVSGRLDPARLPTAISAQTGTFTGSVQVGASTATCNSSAEGTIRYNASSKLMEFCDGTVWTSFAGRLGTTSGNPGSSCKDILDRGSSTGDGTYWIRPAGGSAVEAYCDMANGGWTLLARNDQTTTFTNFNKSWAEYKAGFGTVATKGRGWIGNDTIHYLTNAGSQTLLVRTSGDTHEYRGFTVQNESANYRMTFSTGGSPNSRDGGQFANHNNRPFSTYDRDNDTWSNNCASYYAAAWWYESCYWMTIAGSSGGQVYWRNTGGGAYNVSWIEMWLR
jgi:hypothetical protein